MKRLICSVLTAGLVMCMVTSSSAEIKVAIVDVSRLIQAHPDTKEAEELLKKQADEFETEKAELLEEFDKVKNEFETVRDQSNSKALSEEGREEKREEARAILQRLQELELNLRETTMLRKRELADRKERMGRRIVEKLETLVDTYAKEKGYDLVLDASGRGLSGVQVLFSHNDELDVTVDLLKRLLEQEEQSEDEE